MPEKSQTELEQAVLAAARKLGAVQIKEIHELRRLDAAHAERLRCDAELEEAELELATADQAHATAKMLLITAKRDLRPVEERVVDKCRACDAARAHLYTVATAADDVVLAAARSYGTAALGFHVWSQRRNDLCRQEEKAKVDLTAAADARTAALKRRGKARAALDAAQIAEQGYGCQASCEVFGPESALELAAHELTGTTDAQYASSYLYTRDLPIVLPGEEPAQSA